jgi:hypothetical protein
MITPEKNDVNISKLFNWGGELSLLNNKGEEIKKVYIRLVGDADINRARVHALRRSAELRKKLRDTDSDERLAFIPQIEDLDEDSMRLFILSERLKDLSSRIVKTIDIKFPKEPNSDASLEDQEKYQKEVDEYPDRLDKAIKDRSSEIRKEEESKLNGINKEKLYKEYVESAISQICEMEMVTRFRELVLFYSVYKDEEYKERFFDEFDVFRNLTKSIKDQIETFYSSLELDMEELKK